MAIVPEEHKECLNRLGDDYINKTPYRYCCTDMGSVALYFPVPNFIFQFLTLFSSSQLYLRFTLGSKLRAMILFYCDALSQIAGLVNV
jgi:hypothetical protein